MDSKSYRGQWHTCVQGILIDIYTYSNNTNIIVMYFECRLPTIKVLVIIAFDCSTFHDN